MRSLGNEQADNPSSFFESLPLEEQKEVTDWKDRHQQVNLRERELFVGVSDAADETEKSTRQELEKENVLT